MNYSFKDKILIFCIVAFCIMSIINFIINMGFIFGHDKLPISVGINTSNNSVGHPDKSLLRDDIHRAWNSRQPIVELNKIRSQSSKYGFESVKEFDVWFSSEFGGQLADYMESIRNEEISYKIKVRNYAKFRDYQLRQLNGYFVIIGHSDTTNSNTASQMNTYVKRIVPLPKEASGLRPSINVSKDVINVKYRR